MAGWKRVSQERIGFAEYRWGQLLLALVPGFLLHFVSTIIGWTLKERVEGEVDKSKGAPILVLFHQEFPISLAAQTTWRRTFRGIAWVGIHNWISYVTSVLCYLDGLIAVRYDRRTGKKPMNQVLDFLRENPRVPFAIRTDSGGPYGKVRTSVVRLALEANRPIVCIRQSTDRYFTLLGHYMPLPFGRVVTRISSPMPAQSFAGLTVEEATARVQYVMNYLGERDELPRQLVPVRA